jgi:hypothetical protein
MLAKKYIQQCSLIESIFLMMLCEAAVCKDRKLWHALSA